MKKTYKYQIVSEQKQHQGHMLYLLRYKADNGAKSEYWVGQSRLRRFYEQGRLVDKLSDHVKEVVTAKPIKPVPKGKIKLEPRMEVDGPVYIEPKPEPVSHWTKLKEEMDAPKKWNLPEEFKVEPEKPSINIKSYCYSDPKGRWHVIMCDGVEDEDTYPDQKWAQEMADMYNKEVEENTQ